MEYLTKIQGPNAQTHDVGTPRPSALNKEAAMAFRASGLSGAIAFPASDRASGLNLTRPPRETTIPIMLSPWHGQLQRATSTEASLCVEAASAFPLRQTRLLACALDWHTTCFRPIKASRMTI